VAIGSACAPATKLVVMSWCGAADDAPCAPTTASVATATAATTAKDNLNRDFTTKISSVLFLAPPAGMEKDNPTSLTDH
jgi:hypothetical protein